MKSDKTLITVRVGVKTEDFRSMLARSLNEYYISYHETGDWWADGGRYIWGYQPGPRWNDGFVEEKPCPMEKR